jgi:hypothetical protein
VVGVGLAKNSGEGDAVAAVERCKICAWHGDKRDAKAALYGHHMGCVGGYLFYLIDGNVDGLPGNGSLWSGLSVVFAGLCASPGGVEASFIGVYGGDVLVVCLLVDIAYVGDSSTDVAAQAVGVADPFGLGLGRWLYLRTEKA